MKRFFALIAFISWLIITLALVLSIIGLLAILLFEIADRSWLELGSDLLEILK
jgi:hypothetical protein